MRSSALLWCVWLAICGCTSIAPSPSSAPTPVWPLSSTPAPSADQRAAAPAALAFERKWLQSWFQGTPVLIVQRTDGAATVDVPRQFSFDPGSSSVKPPLAAVLNKVAESLLRMPTVRLQLLAAPDDAPGSEALALARAEQVQKHLLERGVPVARLGIPSATTVAAVQLRLQAAPPP